jgi:hypothetical protein
MLAESGVNGFVPVFVPIDEIPDRDKAWQDMMEQKVGELKFRQEYLCLDFDTLITVRINKEVKQIKIGDLYELLCIEGEEQIRFIET